MARLNFQKIFITVANAVKFLFSRVLLVYLILTAISLHIFNTGNIMEKWKAEELNEIMPSLNYLIAYDEKEGPFDETQLQEHLHYYEKVNEYLPNEADVYSLLGFCYYHSGEIDKAVSFYQKAIETNSHIFWFYYNLGVIYYQQGEYEKAAEYLQAAMDKRPEHALLFVGHSRLYRQIAHGVKNFKEIIEGRLQIGFGQSLALLVLSHYQLGNYEKALGLSAYGPQFTQYDNDFFYYYAGLSAFKIKDYNKAAYFLKEFVKQHPDHREALVHLAMSFKHLGVDQLAELAMQRAILIGEANEASFLTDKDIFIKIF